jgi:hypothetical protein
MQYMINSTRSIGIQNDGYYQCLFYQLYDNLLDKICEYQYCLLIDIKIVLAFDEHEIDVLFEICLF